MSSAGWEGWEGCSTNGGSWKPRTAASLKWNFFILEGCEKFKILRVNYTMDLNSMFQTTKCTGTHG